MSGDDFRHRHAIDPDTLLADARRAFAQRKRNLAGGFLDPGAARRVVRRMRLRTQLRLVLAACTATLDRLDHVSEVDRDRAFALVKRGVELVDRDGESAVGGLPVNLVEGEDVREQELLQGVDLILELLNALADAVGHGLFSSSVDRALKDTAACDGAHRLRGGAK